MSRARESRPGGATRAASESVVATPLQGTDHAPAPRPVDAILPAYCVLVTTPSDRTTRRLFLTLHGAMRAVERAQQRGSSARLDLCQIVPAGVNADA